MSVATNTVLRVVASLLMPDSVIAQNIFYTLITGGAGPYDDDDVVSDVADWIEDIYDSWKLIGDSNVSLNNIRVYKFDPIDDDWDEVSSETGIAVGLVVGDMLPHGIAGYTLARTLDPDVSAKKYWPGITEVSQTEGAWVGAALTQMLDMNVIWMADDTGALTAANFNPGVWSVKNHSFFEFGDSHMVKGAPAYQRRRKPGVGS